MRSDVALRLVGVEPAVAGTATVSRPELEKRLGRGAWAVWQRLIAVRDRKGFAHPTIGGIARLRGHAELSERAVRKGLARLRAAGLVRDIGWCTWQVHTRGSQQLRKVYLREVLGAELLAGRGRCVTWGEQAPARYECQVPPQTVTWMLTAPAWGGSRKGAGRRNAHPCGGANRNPVGVQAMNDEQSSGAHGQESSGAPESTYPRRGLSNTCSPSESTRARGRAGGFSLAESNRLGSVLGGTGNAGPLRRLPPGVPPYPGPQVVDAAKVPTPPRLHSQLVARGPDDELMESAVRKLVRAHRGACLGRLGIEVHAFRRGGLTKSKLYPRLVECAKALAEHEIPPTSWAGFSCDVWSKGGDEAAETVQRLGGDGEVKRYLRGSKGSHGKAPSLSWVMSAHRVTKWRGWFRNEASSYDGGRLVYGPKLKELIGRWQRMQTAIRSGKAPPDAVAEHFPDELGGYDGLVDEARRETQREQARLERAVLRGDWVW